MILKPNWQPASDLVPVPGDTTEGSVPRTRGESSGSPDSSQSTPPPPNALAPDAYQPRTRPCYNVPAPHALKKKKKKRAGVRTCETRTEGDPTEHCTESHPLIANARFLCVKFSTLLHRSFAFTPTPHTSLTSRASSRLSKMPAKSPVSAGQRRRSLR